MPLNTYFDNSATSFPKPPQVASEITRYLDEIGGPYGRSFYERAIAVSRVVEETRDNLAKIIGSANSSNIVFTNNATSAINNVFGNLAIVGKEVLITPLEHNAVMRPLYNISRKGLCSYKILPHFSDGTVDIEKIKDFITDKTSLVVVCHQSNVNGAIQPINKIKKAIGDIPILIDAAQSCGYFPLEVDKNGYDFVAVTGHKALLGPTGTGFLYIKNSQLLDPSLYGGTGSKSESFQMPEFMPDKFEAGTPNIAGIFGLNGALSNKPKPQHSKSDLLNLIEELKCLGKYKVYCANSIEYQGEVFSIIPEQISVSDLGFKLFKEYGIETRVGLHCSPLAHQTLATYPCGALRISPSPYHTKKEFDYLIRALSEIID